MAKVMGDVKGAPARAATLALLFAGFLGVVLLNWPGHLSYDSVLQLLDGRTGRYHTWHPPFMAWLLGSGDRLVRGTGLFITLQAALLFGALAVIVAVRPSLSRFAPALVLVLLLLPQVLLWQAIVWKDVLFADFMVAGFVLLWAACRLARFGRRSLALMCAGLLCLCAASLVRQNGLFALLLGGAALGWDRFQKTEGLARRRVLKALALVAPAMLASFAVILLATAALRLSSIDGDGAEAQIHMLQTYDVVGVVAHDSAVRLDELPPNLVPIVRSTARTLYTPKRNDDLLGTAFNRETATAADDMEAQWATLVIHHPGSWFQHRIEVFVWMLTAPHRICFSETTGIDGAPQMLKALGMLPGQNARDLALEQYAGAFYDTPLYSHLFYAALALVLTVLMFRSKAREDAVFGFMLAAAGLFVASFFLIGVACDYRYLYALDLATIVVAFHWALGVEIPRSRLPGRDVA